MTFCPTPTEEDPPLLLYDVCLFVSYLCAERRAWLNPPSFSVLTVRLLRHELVEVSSPPSEPQDPDQGPTVHVSDGSKRPMAEVFDAEPEGAEAHGGFSAKAWLFCRRTLEGLWNHASATRIFEHQLPFLYMSLSPRLKASYRQKHLLHPLPRSVNAAHVGSLAPAAGSTVEVPRSCARGRRTLEVTAAARVPEPGL